MRPHFLAFVAVALLFPLACSMGAQNKFERKFTVAPGGTLTVNTDVGNVQVTGGSGNEVVIVADIRGREQEVKDFAITADQSGNNVRVEGKMPRNHGSNNLDVQFTISVPRKYNGEVNTAGGNVSMRGLEGTMSGATSGGNVDMVEISGPVKYQTSGGNIHAEKVRGDLDMSTSGGNIQITDITGNVDVETSGGNVHVADVDGKVNASTSGGDVSVKVKGENKGVVAKTSGGDVEIAVPAKTAATIDASTMGGDVRCDLPLTTSGKISEEHIRGTVNGGGPEIIAKTSGGSIRITAR